MFHAGTEAAADGTIRAAGGRVLTICATGADVAEAREPAYAGGGRDRLAGGLLPPRHRRWRAMSTVVEDRGDRIAKWLSRAGVASRRDAERMLAEGAIRLNGRVVTHPATFIAPGDVVQVHGKVVDQPDRTRVWRYHKPEGW